MGQHSGESGGEAPLFVDLDGTLVKSDLLIESILALVKSEPAACLSVIAWLRRGKAYLKSKIAEKVDINAQTLPYHRKFLEFLRAEAARGRSLYLTTAANQKFASGVASYLGIFNRVLASSDEVNLKGRRKLVEIQKVCAGGQFDYAGNARADIDIWRHARRALLVNPQPTVELAARKIGNISKVFDDRQNRFLLYIKALRLHQWLKNLLLFVPILTTHAWRLEVFVPASVAVVAFGLAASSVYLLQDMLDLEFDRAHPQRCTRPFAAGAVPLLHGLALIVVLVLMSLALGSVLSSRFLAVVGVYLALSTAYLVYLKQYLFIHVLVLALLYTLRVIAGAVAVEVVMSFRLFAFSMFLFMSLAWVRALPNRDP